MESEEGRNEGVQSCTAKDNILWHLNRLTVHRLPDSANCLSSIYLCLAERVWVVLMRKEATRMWDATSNFKLQA
jgi:hypothetical protein